MNFNDPDLYERYRPVVHECGHAAAAWLSPAVVFVQRITFHSDGGAITDIDYWVGHAEFHLERMVISMAGMAAEIIVWKKVRAVGFQNDLANAWMAAEAVSQDSSPKDVACRWGSSLSDTTMDVARMLVEKPPKRVGELMNLAFRRAKWLLLENRAGFDRLCVLAAGKDIVTRDEIRSQFGPRPWGPGGR